MSPEPTIDLRIQGENITAYDRETRTTFGAGRYLAETFYSPETYVCGFCTKLLWSETSFRRHIGVEMNQHLRRRKEQ